MLTYASAFTFLLLVAITVAEPPVRQNSKFSQQFPNSQPRAFQPFLLRPLGGQFVILEQLQNVPQTVDNPQSDSPQINPQEDVRNVTEIAKTNSTEAEPKPAADGRSEKLTKAEDEGIYYIYHPNGLLQKVIYATKDDVERMAYSARLKYENVEPIREPIYTYDPETFIFKRL